MRIVKSLLPYYLFHGLRCQDLLDGIGRHFVSGADRVGVGIGGSRGLGVTEAVGDGAHVDTGSDHESGVGMTQ